MKKKRKKKEHKKIIRFLVLKQIERLYLWSIENNNERVRKREKDGVSQTAKIYEIFVLNRGLDYEKQRCY